MACDLLRDTGPQQADPEFHDHASFLKDLGAWLGLETEGKELSDLEQACLSALAGTGTILLFVDNLETIQDRRLLDFIDHKLPANVWRVVTSRVHRIRSYIFPYDLQELKPRDAARLLRYELKRQGLDVLAAVDINELERVAGELFYHPLAIRWFAWTCSRDKGFVGPRT